jgi:hypothetical protein
LACPVRHCPPGGHHLYVAVKVRAKVVLTPDEETFEFFGDNPRHLQILDVECVECDMTFQDVSLPDDVRDRIDNALEEASIMQPLTW